MVVGPAVTASAHLVDPDFIARTKGSFDAKYGRFFSADKKKELFDKMATCTQVEALQFYQAMIDIGKQHERLEVETANVTRQENEIKAYAAGTYSPKAEGERIGTSSIDSETLRQANGGAYFGGFDEELKTIREDKTPKTHWKTPPLAYRCNVANARVSLNVEKDIIKLTTDELASGVIMPSVVRSRLAVGDAGTAARSAQRGAASALRHFSNAVDRLLISCFLRGITASTDHTHLARYEQARKLQHELLSASPFASWYGSAIGDVGYSPEIDRIMVGGRVLSIEEFNGAFSDIIETFRAQMGPLEKQKREMLDKFEKKIQAVHESFYSKMKEATADSDSHHKFRIIQALLIISPFAGLSILPQVLGAFAPAFHGNIGGILSPHELGFLSEITRGLGIDKFANWFLNNFPVIKDFTNLFNSTVQSGVGQGVMAMLGSISPIFIELGGAGVAAFKGAGAEIDIQDKFSGASQKHDKEMREVHVGLSEESHEFERSVSRKVAAIKAEERKEVYLEEQVVKFLTMGATAYNPVNSSAIRDRLKLMFGDIDVGGGQTMNDVIDANHNMEGLLAVRGALDDGARKQLRERFLYFSAVCKEELVNYLVEGQYDADCARGVDMFGSCHWLDMNNLRYKDNAFGVRVLKSAEELMRDLGNLEEYYVAEMENKFFEHFAVLTNHFGPALDVRGAEFSHKLNAAAYDAEAPAKKQEMTSKMKKHYEEGFYIDMANGVDASGVSVRDKYMRSDKAKLAKDVVLQYYDAAVCASSDVRLRGAAPLNARSSMQLVSPVGAR